MSVLRNDGITTWLTKLDRIGEQSASRHDIVFNNIGHIIDNDLLKELYANLDGKKAVGVDKVSKAAYGENLMAPQKNLWVVLGTGRSPMA